MEEQKNNLDARPEWLKQLTDKSWNLELIISGAAIFMASYLPSGVDEMLRYYLENLVVDEDIKKISLPLLAYSFLKVVAWMLICTFIVHFIMRAFWASMVGLHAVYEQGIQYDKIPWQTEFTQQQLKERHGTLADYIYRSDRMANQVFALAFMVALMSTGIGMVYMIIFTAMNVLPVVIGETSGEIIGSLIVFMYVVFAMLPMLAQMAMRNKRLSSIYWVKKAAAWVMKYAGMVLLPFFSRPIAYLNMTFSSNTSKTKQTLITFLLSVVIMSGVMITFVNVASHLAGRQAYTTRNFFASGRNNYVLTGGLYDNMRGPEERLPPVSLPSEVIEGPFLRVFIDYPKYLDIRLRKMCSTPELPDSLKKTRKRFITDSIHIQCSNQFFEILLNDSIIKSPDLMFHKHPITDAPGWVGFLPSANFKTGKNLLRVRIPSAQRADSLCVYGEVPFWFKQ